MLAMLSVVAAAGGFDLTPVKDLVQSLADGLTTLLIPIGIVGIIVGVVMFLIGNHHSATAIRNSFIAIAVGGMAKIIATALANLGGGTTGG